MKKFLTFTLALVFALGMAAPAMAFTGDEPTAPADVPFEIALELVEYDTSDWTIGAFSAPPSDRGYAKNEIVCAVASLYVPKKGDPWDNGFKTFAFSGEDVTLKVNETVITSNSVNDLTDAAAVKPGLQTSAVNTDGEIVVNLGTGATSYFVNTSANKTYAWAFFAKVTGDEASLTAALSKGLSFPDGTGASLVIGDYTVTSTGVVGTNEQFAVTDGAVKVFNIYTGKNNKSTKMSVFVQTAITPAVVGNEYEIGTDLATGELFFACLSGSTTFVADKDGVDQPILYSTSTGDAGRLYNQLLGVYEDVIVDEFGFDFAMKGNAVERKHFETISGSDDLEETVVIEPWFAYVEVPPEVIVDPPKTGDAMSIVGFIMIAVAALAVVTVKKVRA